MTDGKDEHSKSTQQEVESKVRIEAGQLAPVRIFTIAYGQGAQAEVLGRIAEAAEGSSASGDASSIIQVYQDIASFF